jgi:pimeloyl-ACP methyl ester carboxylesterase
MVRLPEYEWGDAAASARALLVHGLSSDSDSWWRVADALVADGWHVTAVDLRGHGSAPRAESYSLDDYAGDLPRGWDLVVGHSLGAAASVLAAQAPGFTRLLVLLDPVLDVPVADATAIIADQVAELDYTAESIARDKPHWHERDRAAKLSGVRRVDPAAVTRTFSDTGRWDVTAQARALTVPTLILSGDPEVYTMLDPVLGRELGAVIVEGAGHSPHRDRPEQTLAALREWLLLHGGIGGPRSGD